MRQQDNPSSGEIIQLMIVGVGMLWIIGRIKSPAEAIRAALPPNPFDPTMPPFTVAEAVLITRVDYDKALVAGSGMNVNWYFSHRGPATSYICVFDIMTYGLFGLGRSVVQRIEASIAVDNDPEFYPYTVGKTEIFLGTRGIYAPAFYIRRGEQKLASGVGTEIYVT